MIECIYIEGAKYLDGYRIFLRFNDGKSGIVDLKETVFRHPVASPLREPEAFSRFYLDSWPTLAWDCGFDVAPETLYEKCCVVNQNDQIIAVADKKS
ncbi:DUF2442 domain-containing protein [Chlorobaculum thiosulfatiphilum]|uniref:DUF2442 domain-containing protein n=1 Tax=Chlorobaculum thiosulfatiphilum TaxID=115852 RepID=A0A5C4S242_CHLTI|nr:DUF2442 domain-containing protein [Chlorobaculum thiosulfatiphilum]TNJ37573.1 DUF2442 domain-containing protein [Chlorobaculum thiosulfatiphilum]